MKSRDRTKLGVFALGVILITYGVFFSGGSDNSSYNGQEMSNDDDNGETVVISTPTPMPRVTINGSEADKLKEKYRKMCEHREKVFNCVNFIKNYDADTITVDIPNVHPLIGKSISVRIRGVDTPEMKGNLPCERDVALKAKAFVFNKLKNAKFIRLDNVAKDKYFRILADVHADGEDISKGLLQKGYAYPYFGGTKERLNWCLKH